MSIMQLLPTFKGYLVDEAMQRFRKIPGKKGEPSEYIPFASPQGQKMLKEYIAVCKDVMRRVAKLRKATRV
jgi:hypothetical protein